MRYSQSWKVKLKLTKSNLENIIELIKGGMGHGDKEMGTEMDDCIDLSS